MPSGKSLQRKIWGPSLSLPAAYHRDVVALTAFLDPRDCVHHTLGVAEQWAGRNPGPWWLCGTMTPVLHHLSPNILYNKWLSTLSPCCFEFFCPMQPNLICTNIVANIFSRIYPCKRFLGRGKLKGLMKRWFFPVNNHKFYKCLFLWKHMSLLFTMFKFWIIASCSAIQGKRKKQE